MSKSYLFLMLGLPGSGKTYFAENLAKKMGAIHLNSDAMRMAIFGSREETDKIYHSKSRLILNTYTFGALNYAALSALKSGSSVIYDANNNTEQERLDTVAAMQGDGAVPVVVWVQTAQEVAVKRVLERRETASQRRLSADVAQAYITKIAGETEPPSKDESLIIIDGTIPFEDQFIAFSNQLEGIDE